jgi:hypothetical protein
MYWGRAGAVLFHLFQQGNPMIGKRSCQEGGDLAEKTTNLINGIFIYPESPDRAVACSAGYCYSSPMQNHGIW